MQNCSTDQFVFLTALEWLQQDYDVILVTVLKTWGSAPRPPGSLMIMRQDGCCNHDCFLTTMQFMNTERLAS